MEQGGDPTQRTEFSEFRKQRLEYRHLEVKEQSTREVRDTGLKKDLQKFA